MIEAITDFKDWHKLDENETINTITEMIEEIKFMKKSMYKELNKAWEHIKNQKDKTKREYWFMTEWYTSLKKWLGEEKYEEVEE